MSCDNPNYKSLKFEVLTNDSLISLSEQYNGEFYKQVKSNSAIIEKLSNKTFIMLPSYGNKGILFWDEDFMEKMIEDENYPEETDAGTFYELYRKEILGLQNNSNNASILFFERKFTEISGLKFDYSFSLFFLNKLESVIRGNKKDKNKLDELYTTSMILFNEGIRREINAKWKYDEQYSLNKFYIPYICSNGVRIEVNSIISNRFYVSSYKLGFKELLINILDDYLFRKLDKYDVVLFNKNLNENFDENFINYLKAINEGKMKF